MSMAFSDGIIDGSADGAFPVGAPFGVGASSYPKTLEQAR
jgi:hypothetical protein